MFRGPNDPPTGRFVVLEHVRNGVHWDFFLDVDPDALLKCWAIDAPPRPGVDLPARALPDHRRLYLDYEGPVSGGRGTVRRWDEGRYVARVWEPTRILLDLRGTQLAGPTLLTESAGTVSSDGATAGLIWTFRFGKVD